MAEMNSRMGGVEHDESLERAKIELAAVKQDLALLRSDMKALLGSLNGGTSGRVKDAKMKLMETTYQAKEEAKARLHHAYDSLRDRGSAVYARVHDQSRAAYLTARAQGRDAAEKARARIEERPLTAMLMALGLGMLLGKLMKRR